MIKNKVLFVSILLSSIPVAYSMDNKRALMTPVAPEAKTQKQREGDVAQHAQALVQSQPVLTVPVFLNSAIDLKGLLERFEQQGTLEPLNKTELINQLKSMQVQLSLLLTENFRPLRENIILEHKKLNDENLFISSLQQQPIREELFRYLSLRDIAHLRRSCTQLRHIFAETLRLKIDLSQKQYSCRVKGVLKIAATCRDELVKLSHRQEASIRPLELDLSGNHLRDLPDEMGALRNLRKLNLAENKLKTEAIRKICGWFAHLEDLDLSNVHFDSVPTEITNLKEIKKFTMLGTYFKPEQLKKLFLWFPQLEELGLDFHCLMDASAQEEIKKLANLKKLTLMGGEWTKFIRPASIPFEEAYAKSRADQKELLRNLLISLPKIEELVLIECHCLHEILDEIKNLTRLKRLEIQYYHHFEAEQFKEEIKGKFPDIEITFSQGVYKLRVAFSIDN